MKDVHEGREENSQQRDEGIEKMREVRDGRVKTTKEDMERK